MVCWDRQAELISRYVKKGDQVCIRGYLTTRTWTDNQGQKRYATEVVADEVSFVGNNSSTTEAKPQQPSSSGNYGYAPTAYGGTNSPQFEEVPNDGDLPF